MTILSTCFALLFASFIGSYSLISNLAWAYRQIRVNNSLPLVSDHIIILRKLLIVNSLIGLAQVVSVCSNPDHHVADEIGQVSLCRPRVSVEGEHIHQILRMGKKNKHCLFPEQFAIRGQNPVERLYAMLNCVRNRANGYERNLPR